MGGEACTQEGTDGHPCGPESPEEKKQGQGPSGAGDAEGLVQKVGSGPGTAKEDVGMNPGCSMGHVGDLENDCHGLH